MLRENSLLREEISAQLSHIQRLTSEVQSLSDNVQLVKKRGRGREQERIDRAKTSDDADLEISGDSLEFPRQPVHVII